MVLGGDDDIFHAGIHGELRPSLRVVLRRGEIPREGPVGGRRNLPLEHDPFRAGRFALPETRGNGINAPVDEEAEPRLAKPAQARLRSFRRLIADYGGQRGQPGGGRSHQNRRSLRRRSRGGGDRE